MIEATKLDRRWSGYTNYLPLLRAARVRGVPVLGLNAPPETIRAIEVSHEFLRGLGRAPGDYFQIISPAAGDQSGDAKGKSPEKPGR